MSITTKKEYLDQLHKYLKKLPREDYEDAMEYFTEYFEETDEEGAQKLMEELGTPKQAARDLIGNLLDKKTNAYRTSAPSPNAYNTTSELPKKRKNSHIMHVLHSLQHRSEGHFLWQPQLLFFTSFSALHFCFYADYCLFSAELSQVLYLLSGGFLQFHFPVLDLPSLPEAGYLYWVSASCPPYLSSGCAV